MRLLLIAIFTLFCSAANAAPVNETAIFAGGCFWSIEGAFDNVPGVVKGTSGYTGGTVVDPSYERVSEGNTGHVEAVKIEYDPKKISYKELLKIYWYNVDPFNEHGQFCDSGPEYRSEIFVMNDAQKEIAMNSKVAVEKQLGKEPVTKILAAEKFYPAEDYHQRYEINNPEAYARYREGCGRDRTTKRIWGDAKPQF